MAISRLFAAETKTKLQLKNKGILKPRRWFCSEPPPPPPPPPNNKREAAREKKTEKIRSFIDSYMLKQPGGAPNTKEVHENVGGSWYTVKNILSEMKMKILPNTQIDKRAVVEEITDASIMGKKLDGDKLGTHEEGSVSCKEILDAEESQIIEVKNSEASEFSNNGNVADFKQMEPLTDILDIKTSDTNCQTNKQTVSKSSNGPNVFSDKSDRSEQGFVLSNGLSDVRKSHAIEVEDSEAMRIGSLKTGTCSELKEGKKHVISMLDVFTRNQIDSKVDNLICEKKPEQDGLLNLKEVREKDPENPGMNPEVKDILDHIIDLPKIRSMTDAPSNKANNELWSFVSGSMNHLCLNEEQTSENQLYKTEIGKAEGQKEKDKHMEALRVKDQRGRKQPGTREIEREMSPFEQDNTANNSSEENDSDIAAFDYAKPEPSYKLPLPIRGSNFSMSENSGPNNLLLIKFLPKTTTRNDIRLAFGDCGHISEICIVNSERVNKFNYAYISFKAEKGLRKALSKDVSICDADVVMEAASFSKACNKTFNMVQAEDVQFPMSFLKNPSRTVMVKGYPGNLSFCPLRDAFSKWGTVSSIAMGSSPSNAYIEFESEEAMEKVLAEAKVSVSGKELSILRVDAPKTTVVRISNLSPLSKLEKIRSICDTYGQVKRLVSRDVDVIDVHFTLSEWTNMVKILNRLNGLVVDQCQWLAQPATVIPTEVLQALWKKPDGRKHIHKIIQSICKRIKENSIDTTVVLDLAKEYYSES